MQFHTALRDLDYQVKRTFESLENGYINQEFDDNIKKEGKKLKKLKFEDIEFLHLKSILKREF